MKNRNLFKTALLIALVAMLFAFSACALTDSSDKPDSVPQESQSATIETYVSNGEIFIFVNGVRVIADEEFVTIGGRIYYAKNNRAATGVVIIGSKIYDFGDDGALNENKVFDKEFVKIGGKTYYIEQNRVAFGLTLIDGTVHDFGDDGNHVPNARFDNEFVKIDGDTYYAINNKIVYGAFILDGKIYDFGDDGKLNENRVFDKELVYFDGNTYYTENNKVSKTVKVENGEIKVYDNDGNLTDLAIDKAFILSDGNRYYVISDEIVKNTYFIVDSTVYSADKDGVVPDKIFDKEFFEIDGNRYYALNGKIVTGINIIEDFVYLFGDDGILSDKIFDNEFFEIGENKYYAVNGKVIKGNYVIEDKAYLFDEDGILTDKVFDGEFFDVGDETYYAEEGVIVKGKIKVIEDGIYEFAASGALNKEKVFEIGFTVVDEKTYYVTTDNKILIGVRIVDMSVYDFGEDGALIPESVFDNEFVTVDDDVYYAVGNSVVTGYKFIVEHIYVFDEDGKLLHSTKHDDYDVSADGTVTAPKGETVFIEVENIRYIVASDYAAPARSISGSVVVSDTETPLSPAEILVGAELKIVFGGITFETESDENGRYEFSDIPETTLTVKSDGYITVETELSGAEDEFDIVMDKAVSIDLFGKVYVADGDFNYNNNRILRGVSLALERINGTNTQKAETTTDDYGEYMFTGLTAGVYRLVATAEGYVPITETLTIRADMTEAYNLALEMFKATDEEKTGSASGTIFDGKTGNPVPGLKVDVYESVTNTSGEIIASAYTDENGQYRFENLKQGNYTLKITDEDAENKFNRYNDCVLQIKVIADKTIEHQNASVVRISDLSKDTVRIVLTWGEKPADLDSHLIYGDGRHVYYGAKNDLGASLDKDGVSGYGTETIIISAPIQGETYEYSVRDFSNERNLLMSGAVVRVYIGYDVSASYTFYVPVEEEGENDDYNVWNVFEFDGTDKTITFIGTTDKEEIINDKK